MKIFTKIFLIIFTISLLWIGIFFGMNYYEKENNCEFQKSENFPFFNCKFIIEEASSSINDTTQWQIIQFWVNASQALHKPLILLYPQQEQQVKVELLSKSGFLATFPEYNNNIDGWEIMAQPDGNLYDFGSKMETYGLFWEAKSYKNNFNLEEWFVIEWKNIKNFLYEKLTEIWLNTKEKSDFIMFWYPKLQDYKYLQITFAWKDYEDEFSLKITPQPDNISRIFMIAKPLENPINIPQQKIPKIKREWFYVVEWGGMILEN